MRERLARTDEVLSYIDLVVYNFRLRDTQHRDPFAVENLSLLFPTIGNREERVFYLTQLEILARTRPVVSLTAMAQDAVLREEDRAVEAALEGIIDCLSIVVRRTLLKLDPNPYSPTHVNPVVWAKTVAPLAVPFHPGIQGPSGTSSPLFNTLDLFFGRKRYESFLGREIKALRATYPRAWQNFLGALTKVSVADYVARSDNRSLKAAWDEALSLYAGQNGFLGRHRMKVYGFLELAFKVGRSVTIGGFGGPFKDRTWDLVDNELVASQAERPHQTTDCLHRARVVRTANDGDEGTARVCRVALDVSHLSLRYRPGDRCLVLPENDERLIARTLAALGASGDERVCMTSEWQALAHVRAELLGLTHISLRDVLRYGCIRPVSARMAEALHARTQSRQLLHGIVEGCTEKLALWEQLRGLAAEGVDPTSLWREPDGPPSERLCRLIPPLQYRVYSISSVAEDAQGHPNPELELTVGQLQYTGAPASDGEVLRRGTASSFLMQALRSGREVPFVIERPDRFVLPDDPEVPVVMFAGGTGISPFRAFLTARARAPVPTHDWLFLSLRSPAEFLYADELVDSLTRGTLELSLSCTREGATFVRTESGTFSLAPGPTRRVEDLMLEQGAATRLFHLLLPKSEGGAGAHVYICGRSGFASNVLGSLERIFRRHMEGGSEALARQMLYRLAGEGRLVQEIHSDAQPVAQSPARIELSELATHNCAERGYWMAIERSVYDLTEFMELHPGGRRIVQAYAGMDATHGFRRAHHQRSDVDAMRESYRIGVLRNHSFDSYSVEVAGPRGPLTVDTAALHRAVANALQMVVEMQNALSADQSLQSEQVGSEPGPGERSPYKLARALETHHRFVASYLDVLVSETLPSLWLLCRGLLFPEERAAWMEEALVEATTSEPAERARMMTKTLSVDLETFLSSPHSAEAQAILERTDRWFLVEIKQTLIEALREFERHGTRTRQLGAANLKDSCQRAAQLVAYYYRTLAAALSEWFDELAPRAAPSEPPPAVAAPGRRLHTGLHWVLEEEPWHKLAVLQRTPRALTSLHALCAENEQILSCLTEAHREYGLVVDTRRAPLRNDPAFEDAMVGLRSGLTGHFKRTAVLLESDVGTLQVERLERDERRQTMVTCSESSAFKFAVGGS